MANYKINKDFSLGAGLSSHQRIRFFADGIEDDIAFDAASGPRVEFGYKGIGLTYTIMDYKSPLMEVYSAKVFGFIYTYEFSKK